MPINVDDIKLLASRVMDDIPNGGGAPTANVIQDGVSNAIFNDISEVDRAGGNVSLRKMFVSVQTPTTDIYLGANLVVADPPADPNVSVTLFSTADVFDTRASAESRVAAYLNAGPEWPGFLLEDHIAGQRVIQIFARPGVAAPNVGRTLVLRQNEGAANQQEQYVRVIRAAAEERTFTFSGPGGPVDYQAQVITCDLSDALRLDFSGSPASRLFAPAAGKTRIRDTVVADAAAYYGATRLAQPALLGDVKVRAEEIYSQLVPNAQTETALVDVRPAANYSVPLATVPREISVGGSPFSQRIRVGQENRSYNYVTILTPLPAPGSVVATFRALGNTYSLKDDGQGNLSGSGSGRVNYLTGSVSVTLQALPDDRSAVVFYWGQVTRYTNRAGNITVPPPKTALLLPAPGKIIPESIAIGWSAGGVAKSALCDSLCNVTGDAVGRFYKSTGLLQLMDFAVMPDATGEFFVQYETRHTVIEPHHGLAVDAGGFVSFGLAEEPEPGTVVVEWATSVTTSTTRGVSAEAGSITKSGDSGSSVVTQSVPPLSMPRIGYN